MKRPHNAGRIPEDRHIALRLLSARLNRSKDVLIEEGVTDMLEAGIEALPQPPVLLPTGVVLKQAGKLSGPINSKVKEVVVYSGYSKDQLVFHVVNRLLAKYVVPADECKRDESC